MSYTAPEGNAVDFNFTDTGYTSPAGDAVALSIAGVVSFTGSPGQGIVNLSGLQPGLSAGFTGAAIALQVNLTGLLPDAPMGRFTGQPAQGEIALTGLQPSLAAGFADAAAALQIDIIGLQPDGSFFLPFIETANQGTIALTGLQPSLSAGFTGSATALQIDLIGLLPDAPMNRFIVQAAQGVITFSGLQPSLAEGFSASPVQRLLDWIGQLPTLKTRNISEPPTGWVAVRYRCYLTPPGSTVYDIEIPISSFQSRLRLNGLSYLSVVLKGADAYADQILAAANRKMRIFREYYYLDGSINSNVIAAADYETLQLAEGGKSGITATLSGNGDFVPSNFETVALTDPTYRSASTNGRRYRCAIDARLRPGDTAQINGESFVVNEIVYVVDTKTSIMEIAE